MVVPPILEVEKAIWFVSNPLDNTCIASLTLTCPVGLTVIVKVIGSPILVFPPFSKLGVTTIFPVIGWLDVLVAIISIFPVPALESPIFELSLVHE